MPPAMRCVASMYAYILVGALCIQPAPGNIVNKDILGMSTILEKKVVDEIYSKVHADELQKAYDEVPYRTEITDGNVLCAGSAAKIAVIVEQKDSVLQNIATHIENLYRNNPKPKQRMQLDETDDLANASKIVGVAPDSTLEEDIYVTRSLLERLFLTVPRLSAKEIEKEGCVQSCRNIDKK